MSQLTDLYAAPSSMTDLSGVDGNLLDGLPEDTAGILELSRGLIVHEYLAGAYGLGDVSDRFDELDTRPSDQIVSTIVRRDPRPLVEPRPPEARVVGNCRQFAVLTCAFLRRSGLPTRVRAGFSGYFDDTWVDHWVVERWDEESTSWVKTDPQIDETQIGIFDIQFDPHHLPDGVFLTGSEAWRLYRDSGADPQLFGIQDMRGPWFIAASVIRDLACLNRVETHVWDTWGVMDDLVFGDLSADQIEIVDRIADTVLSGSHDGIVALYQQDGIRVPDEVTSARFERRVGL